MSKVYGKLKPFVNNFELYDAFQEVLTYQLTLAQKELENEIVPESIYRIQGRIGHIRHMQNLRERVHGSDKA